PGPSPRLPPRPKVPARPQPAELPRYPPGHRRRTAGAVYTDFNPLRQVMSWKEKLAHKLHCPLVEIDTHNIIPCRIASEKQEYAARTFRPRVERQLDQWLHEFPREAAPSASQSIFFSRGCMQAVDGTNQSDSDTSINTRLNSLYMSTRSYFEKFVSGSSLVDLPLSGCTAAGKRLYDFITEGLQNYTKKNDPNEPVVAGLSPYLHFGQISAQRVALEVRLAADNLPEIRTAAAEFIEELIVRRELSDNFCFYNKNYDSFEGFPAWAQKTLKEHTNDMRPYLYSQNQLEHGETHDELWNAAQLNMIRIGSMPGYLRMYWAKKILEWTVSPEEALSITIRLNDRYMLDGRDPNGYTGAAWSIGGVHDRPWVDRPIFGKIRLMTLSGCRRKFDVDAWISNNS
ncbi:MAG: hypothetical protein GX028_09130, partial [Clostridiaceae bacterium]|nr:hypothetical protein [Clostridiaceae bacterium]